MKYIYYVVLYEYGKPHTSHRAGPFTAVQVDGDTLTGWAYAPRVPVLRATYEPERNGWVVDEGNVYDGFRVEVLAK